MALALPLLGRKNETVSEKKALGAMNWKLRLAVVAFGLTFFFGLSAAFAQSEKKPTVAELLQRLQAAEGFQWELVMRELDEIQDPNVLVPPLLAALANVDPENAPKLLDVLVRFPDAQVAAPLVQLARRADQIPRGMEEFLRGEPARKELLKALSEVCTSWKPPAKYSDDSSAQELTAEDGQAMKSQRFIQWAGAALANTDSSGLDQLLAMLRDHSACRQTAAQGGLLSIILRADQIDPRIVRVVTAALSDADSGVQQSAVLTLKPLIGFDKAALAKDMLDPLFQILKSNPDYEARQAAFGLLRRAPGDAPKRAAELALHDPDDHIQRSAEEFLEQLSAATPDEKP
jgi:hypothetical protein